MVFYVEGNPKGKARPRFTNQGGFARAYQTKADKEWEEKIRTAFLDAGGTKIDGFCSVDIKARFGIPKSYTKKEKQHILAHNEPYTKKPDIDNIIKSVLDALNGVAYEDDKQVIKVKCVKSYAIGVEPGLEILIYENDTFA